MTKTVGRVYVGVVSLIMVAAGGAVPTIDASATSAPTRGAAGGCPDIAGLTRADWDGPNGGLWRRAANWSGNQVPGRRGDPTSPNYVCLDDDKTVVMNGSTAILQAIDVRGDTTVVLRYGAHLFANGRAGRTSHVRAGAMVWLQGSNAVGGVGRWVVDGVVRLQSLHKDNALVSRSCVFVDGPCTGSIEDDGEQTGLMVIGDKGLLLVNGDPPGTNDSAGVNVYDRYQLEVHGTMRLANKGYLSANAGTSLSLLPRSKIAGVGTFDIQNDGGYYQGSDDSFLPGVHLSTLTNRGLIEKSGGTGTSVITAKYSESPAKAGEQRVDVGRGALALPRGPVRAASVAKSAAIGSGKCIPKLGQHLFECRPVARDTGADGQLTSVRVGNRDRGGARIDFKKLAPRLPGDVGVPVLITNSGLTATPAHPAIIELHYSSALMGSGTTDDDVKVLRAEGGPYKVVPTCGHSGSPRPHGACVDRQHSRTTSREVIMVIRTTGTSRWCVRKGRIH